MNINALSKHQQPMSSKITEQSSLAITDDEVTPAQIKRFLQSIEESTCYYYASDFLEIQDDKNMGNVENRVHQMFEVFQTLKIPTENHCYLVFRCTHESVVYKDWKISELACAYMFMHGDLSDVRVIAKQQSRLLEQILNMKHTKKTVPFI